jgi:DUF4097 and DUF4098 domain-containing protein YvlB
LAVALALGGCGFAVNLNERFTAEDTETKTFKVKDAPRVVVETFNGDIDVTAVSAGTVQAKVTKHTRGATQDEADEDLDNIEVTMTQAGDTINIRARETQRKLMGSGRGARVELQTPPGSVLDLKTSNGKVAAQGATDDVKAQTSNAAITVKGSKGKLQLTTSNGKITAEGGAGRLELKTSNGGIVAQAEDVVVDAETSNAGIQWLGRLSEGKSSFRTSNAKVVVALPGDASFKVDAHTSNATITTDFALPTSARKRKAQLTATVGENPAAQIKIHTSNGAVEIKKSN